VQLAFQKFGFISFHENSIETPHCVVCFKVLTQESWKPSKLKQPGPALASAGPD